VDCVFTYLVAGALIMYVSLASTERTPVLTEERNYSDKTAELIDEEVHRLVDESYEISKSIVLTRREQLDLIGRELIQKETLDRAALDALIRTDAAATAREAA
jgi:cell division protease FtsH